MGSCNRYDVYGNQCQNLAEYADGWCRGDGCPGFLRRSPRDAPELKGRKFYGPPDEVRANRSNPANLSANPLNIAVDAAAATMFVVHHGGTTRIAILQIREMLTDFVESAGKITTPADFLSLTMDGYRLFVNPQRNRVTGYSTTHRERTWQQIKAGIPSRFGELEAEPVLTPNGPKEPKPGPVPDTGRRDKVPATPKPKGPETSDEAKNRPDSGRPAESEPAPMPKPQPQPQRQPQPQPQPGRAGPDTAAIPDSNPPKETTATKDSPPDHPLRKIGFVIIAGFAAGWLSRSGRRR